MLRKLRRSLPLLATLALSLLAVPGIADALPIQVLDAQYTIRVSANSDPPTLRSSTSLTPATDTLTIGDWDVAHATAGLFEVEARTSFNGSNTGPTRTGASATSVLVFSPLSNGIALLNLVFDGFSQVRWTDGSVRLEDLTTGDLLLEYGYGYGTSPGTSPIPWLTQWDWTRRTSMP